MAEVTGVSGNRGSSPPVTDLRAPGGTSKARETDRLIQEQLKVGDPANASEIADALKQSYPASKDGARGSAESSSGEESRKTERKPLYVRA